METIEELTAKLDMNRLPRHVAIIMDGNGRWAETRGLPRIAGHREGIHSVRDSVELCRELGIRVLTIYAFSMENWRRPEDEVKELMTLLDVYLRKEIGKLMKNDIRFKTTGRIERLPESVLGSIREAEQTTRDKDKMVLNIALSYGGRTEIVDAALRLAEDIRDGALQPQEVDEERFAGYLGTYDLPDPDLMIRTSGESRISNFLLWQLAYTELYFTPTLWPDFRRREFLKALIDFQQRERRFGRVKKPAPIQT
ncbi:MAG TPA: isoprenyl transferase [Nitrospiria bacterium]